MTDGSPLAAIRAELEATRNKTTEDIPLPGVLERKIAVRYRALGYEKDQQIRSRHERELDQYASVLVNACECILLREGEKWVPLEQDGKKVRFDKTFAAALGVPDGDRGDGTPDTHVIIRGVFAAAAGGLGQPEDGSSPEELWELALVQADHLIDTTHTLYRIWLKGGPAGEDEDDLLGE